MELVDQAVAARGRLAFLFLLITSHPKHGSAVLTAAVFAVVAFAIYLPARDYLEVFLYNRRMAKQPGAAKR